MAGDVRYGLYIGGLPGTHDRGLTGVDPTDLNALETKLNEDGAQGLEFLSLSYEPVRVQAHGPTGAPYAGRKVNVSGLYRVDLNPVRWEYRLSSWTRPADEVSMEEVERVVGDLTGELERDGWQIVGFYQGVYSTTIRFDKESEPVEADTVGIVVAGKRRAA